MTKCIAISCKRQTQKETQCNMIGLSLSSLSYCLPFFLVLTFALIVLCCKPSLSLSLHCFVLCCVLCDECSLFVAAENGYPQICELLLDHGAEIDLKNKSGNSPLHMAIAHNHFQTTKVLLERGQSPTNQPTPPPSQHTSSSLACAALWLVVSDEW
jgi:hypothetical protein